MPVPNLLDIAALNNSDQVVGLIDENIRYTPELEIIPARSIKGTSYKTTLVTGDPSVGFRAANEGNTPSKVSFRNDLHQCFILSGRIECDKAVADAYDQGREEFEMIQSSRVMKSILYAVGLQVYYGINASASGFAGLKAYTPFGGAYNYNAAGTTASTASSVYMIVAGLHDVNFQVGQNAQLSLPPFRDETIYDTNTPARPIPGRVSDFTGWLGLQIGSKYSVVRICNLTADSGKGLTDAVLYSAQELFPSGVKPTHICMSRRSRRQLQISRTVTLFGQGTTRPSQPLVAPMPTEFEGIPIVATDSILNTDAIET
jgi:hypothetical protein